MGIALFEDTLLQAESVRHTRHRQWPPPGRSWRMGQSWCDLLFAHWSVPASALRPHIPSGLEIDEFDGTAWVGVTPFVVEGLRLRGTLPIPFLSRFPEWNVRTYVTAGGKPGIWFFSLNTPSGAAIQTARRMYRLPYYASDVETEAFEDGGRRFDAVRPRDGAMLRSSYTPHGGVHYAKPGSIEHFLAERYCLYTEHDNAIYRAEIHHGPWPLQHATGTCEARSVTPRGIELDGEPALMHLGRRVDVVLWGLERVPKGELRLAGVSV